MPKKQFSLGRELAEATSISIELVVPVVLGAYMGYKIDEYFRIFPWSLMIGVILGGITGMWTVFKFYVIGKK